MYASFKYGISYYDGSLLLVFSQKHFFAISSDYILMRTTLFINLRIWFVTFSTMEIIGKGLVIADNLYKILTSCPSVCLLYEG